MRLRRIASMRLATRAVTHAMAESSDHRPVFPGFRAGFAEIAGLECTG
jgi:hypothetical protein